MSKVRVFPQQFFEQLIPKLYRLAMGILHDTDAAKDAVQDTNLKLLNLSQSIDNPTAYAFRILKNTCIDRLRRPTPISSDDTPELVSRADDSVPQQIENKDLYAHIEQLMRTLPIQQQLIVRLRDIEGLEYTEIAEIMQLSEGNIRTNLSRARQTLRIQLSKIV